jgi:ABC-type transport system involved in cytochrome c biogenesis permease subunit
MNRRLSAAIGIAALLAGSCSIAAAKAPSEPAAVRYGDGKAYRSLGSLPVMHMGRVKPFDTVAREVVKLVYSRETIKLKEHGKVVATWAPVAALFDWSVRPEFWNDQDFIYVDYLPLREAILAKSVAAMRSTLEKRAAAKDASAADRFAIESLLKVEKWDDRTLGRAALDGSISNELRVLLADWSDRLSPASAWVSPRTIEAARIKIGGEEVDFAAWMADLGGRQRRDASSMGGEGANFSTLERKAMEVGKRLMHFRVVRDRLTGSDLAMLIEPRPTGESYLKFCAETLEHAQDHDLSLFERDTADMLGSYLDDIPRKDWRLPGQDKKFDAALYSWLKSNAEWVPLPVFLNEDAAKLSRAGYPSDKISAFQSAFRNIEKSEDEHPGDLDVAAADRFLAAARSLGESVNPSAYPATAKIALETHFNSFGPFFKAPALYGSALALFVLCLTFSAARSTGARMIGGLFYKLGVAAFLGGIGLEIYGFFLRISISGWAPVTNMYETVIWVALVCALIGFILELIYRKTYIGLAATSVSLLGTVLAANVSLLDPGIHSLQPVLRSNLWLTIHVLTEVSSYAAFALGWALGLIATCYYLVATYRSNASLSRLSVPLFVGSPIFAAGVAGMAGANLGFGPGWLADDFYYFQVLLPITAFGGLITGAGIFAILGELTSRALFASRDWSSVIEQASLDAAWNDADREPAPKYHDRATTVIDRALRGGSLPPADPREASMRETSVKVKMITTFIYRAITIGILLIIVGTFLGGVWADYSWGRFWGWDPKEVWALITLLVYLIPFHGRFAGWVKPFGLAGLSIACFLSVVMAWYGVNFVLGVGLHSYGFVEGQGQGAVTMACVGFLSFFGGAAWRRHVAKSSPAYTDLKKIKSLAELDEELVTTG